MAAKTVKKHYQRCGVGKHEKDYIHIPKKWFEYLAGVLGWGTLWLFITKAIYFAMMNPAAILFRQLCVAIAAVIGCMFVLVVLVLVCLGSPVYN